MQCQVLKGGRTKYTHVQSFAKDLRIKIRINTYVRKLKFLGVLGATIRVCDCTHVRIYMFPRWTKRVGCFVQVEALSVFQAFFKASTHYHVREWLVQGGTLHEVGV